MPGARQRLTRTRVVLGAAVALTIAACGGGDEAPAEKPTQAATPAPAPAPKRPVALQPGDATAGGEQYALFCASCHGDDGCGDGPLAGTLDPKPARHCDGHVMNALDDAYLTQVITEGGPAVGKSPMMAPWGPSLSEQQIVDIVAFIRSLADPPYPGG